MKERDPVPATPTIPDLASIPREALVAALATRPGVATRVIGKDTTIHAEIVTMSQRRMERDRDTITGPCTVLIIDPEKST